MARKADGAPAPDAGPVAEAAAEAAPRKGSRRLVVILVPALIVGLLSGAGLGVAQNDTLARLYAMMEEPEPAADSVATAPGPDDVPEAFGVFSEMTGLIVNPAGTDGSRYLMVNLAFEGSDKAVAELAEREIVVKDRLLRHLAEQPVERLAAFANRDTLKRELLARTNAVLKAGQIDRLYFTQYVLQ